MTDLKRARGHQLRVGLNALHMIYIYVLYSRFSLFSSTCFQRKRITRSIRLCSHATFDRAVFKHACMHIKYRYFGWNDVPACNR